MKRIDAIVRHSMLDAVKQALQDIGVGGMTVTEVRGFGRQRGQTETYRGTEYQVDFVPKAMIVLFVSDEQTPAILDTIVRAARSGQIGDGKIAVSSIEDLVRIRTGESGEEAL